ncbi:hypothetical protein PV325_011120 [Microctonus aethiopoides]|nr:hypothetical protein PV325_011120 [Microctonus aethiopoides]
MVSQHAYAMGTTVRKVKQENRLRRQNHKEGDEETINKTISSSKSMSNNNSINTKINLELTQNSCGPKYRMPPLYGEEQSSNQRTPNLQTHSNKFPIEREVILTSTDKNTKIPILHEYNKQRSAGRVAIAPDAPVKQQAWVQEANQMPEHRQETPQNYQSHENYSSTSTGAVPRIVKTDDERTKTLTKTYHTIKDMISSRFGPSRKDIEPERQVSLNNVMEDIGKSSRSIDIDQDDLKKNDGIYGKARAHDPPPINMQHFPKNNYGQQQYNQQYYQSPQQNIIPLPGQLQTAAQVQPSLPGQSAQLHVSHITPPGGVQTVHQTQVSTYNQQQVPSRGDYVVQGPNGGGTMSQIQTPPVGKHGLPMQPITANVVNKNYQSPQQLLHQSQILNSPRFSHQHVQNMHQRQLIQQLHQQQQLGAEQQSPRSAIRAQQSQFIGGVSYQQYQQARQTISRSQIDLPSTSRQALDVRLPGQEVYYHYNQSRPRYPAPSSQIYMKQENNQDNDFHRKNSLKCMEKAVSQPQLYHDDRNADERNDNENDNVKKNINAMGGNENYEITVENRKQQQEYDRNENSRRKDDELRPETSFGNRRDNDMGMVGKKDSQLVNSELCQDIGGELNSKDQNNQRRIDESQIKDDSLNKVIDNNDYTRKDNVSQLHETTKRIEETTRRLEINYQSRESKDGRRDDIDNGISRLKIQNQGSGSDYDKAGQSSSNVDSGRGSAVYSSGRRPPPEDQIPQARDTEWVDIVESELRSILEPRDVPAMAHSTLSESVSSVTPPLPPLSPHGSPRIPRNRYSSSLPYGAKPTYGEYVKGTDKRSFPSGTKHRGASTSKKDVAKKFSHLVFGVEATDVTSTTTGLDLDSMLDRSDSDLSTNDARTIRKQLEGLENMYSEVLKLLGGSVKKRRKARGLTSYGSVSSLPTSSVSSRPIARHHDKRRSHIIDDRMKKTKDVKSINKRFQRLESHVVTLARSVAHLSSEMRTQHLMIQEMENIRGEIAALRAQTSMAMVRSQSQPLIKDSELPALSNPSRVKKLTKFFGTEPPLIRLFLRELGYEKYAAAFEKEKVGMVELPYLSEERLQKMGVPLGPRLRILQEARISVCKDPIYVV